MASELKVPAGIGSSRASRIRADLHTGIETMHSTGMDRHAPTSRDSRWRGERVGKNVFVASEFFVIASLPYPARYRTWTLNMIILGKICRSQLQEAAPEA